MTRFEVLLVIALLLVTLAGLRQLTPIKKAMMVVGFLGCVLPLSLDEANGSSSAETRKPEAFSEGWTRSSSAEALKTLRKRGIIPSLHVRASAGLGSWRV
jgi:hypothetical protein